MSTTSLPPLPAGVTVEIHPLRFRPADVAAYARELTGREPKHGRTRDGWPLYLVEQDDRFVAVFEFLDRIGVVFLEGPRHAVLAVLTDARPDWRDAEVIAISELWDER